VLVLILAQDLGQGGTRAVLGRRLLIDVRGQQNDGSASRNARDEKTFFHQLVDDRARVFSVVLSKGVVEVRIDYVNPLVGGLTQALDRLFDELLVGHLRRRRRSSRVLDVLKRRPSGLPGHCLVLLC
jgi:hypothetical protein